MVKKGVTIDDLCLGQVHMMACRSYIHTAPKPMQSHFLSRVPVYVQ